MLNLHHNPWVSVLNFDQNSLSVVNVQLNCTIATKLQSVRFALNSVKCQFSACTRAGLVSVFHLHKRGEGSHTESLHFSPEYRHLLSLSLSQVHKLPSLYNLSVSLLPTSITRLLSYNTHNIIYLSYIFPTCLNSQNITFWINNCNC